MKTLNHVEQMIQGRCVSGTEVFVGKLPRDVYEPHLFPIFSSVGRIYKIRLMMDFSGTNRGYCFVQYGTPEEAQRAIRELNDFEIAKGEDEETTIVASAISCRWVSSSEPVRPLL